MEKNAFMKKIDPIRPCQTIPLSHINYLPAHDRYCDGEMDPLGVQSRD